MKKDQKSSKVRIVSDSMGKINVPIEALYGASTQRALENFPISGIQFNKNFISAVIIIKRSAAIVNNKLSLLSKNKMNAIVKASDYILENDISKELLGLASIQSSPAAGVAMSFKFFDISNHSKIEEFINTANTLYSNNKTIACRVCQIRNVRHVQIRYDLDFPSCLKVWIFRFWVFSI